MEHIPNSFNLARALQLPQKHLDPPLHHQSSLSAVSDAPSMASLAAVCRATARLSSNPAVGARAFTSSSRCLAAQNFTMPALSPTMTEGNIAAWNVKEGDSFSAGDVLLEIETDKATMDVEAQEDGVMFKILSQGGAKGVQVGTRIAVVAEPGDDLSSLEVPAEEKASQPASGAPKEGAAASQASGSGSSQSQSSAVKTSGGGSYEHKLPLLPSTGHLAAQKGLSQEDLSKIKPTGPNGRLLKGDVLAFLGTIDAETPAALSSRFEKLGHLDLSNIKVAAPPKKEEPAKKEAAPAPKAPVIENLEINVPVSLSKVVEVQNKINDTLGVFLPLSTFISRAADMANADLPPPRGSPPPRSSSTRSSAWTRSRPPGAPGASTCPRYPPSPPPHSCPPLPPRSRTSSTSSPPSPRSEPPRLSSPQSPACRAAPTSSAWLSPRPRRRGRRCSWSDARRFWRRSRDGWCCRIFRDSLPPASCNYAPAFRLETIPGFSLQIKN
uniref:Dihydrolipoamide acetyltransferase component of pyruvate dehydrogenase complex n=1 Tax=Bionectria ochroleuca TaxID=29856 RepID=A0A8H7NB22_BIOOC